MQKAELAWESGDRPGTPNFREPVPDVFAKAIISAVSSHLPQEALSTATLTALHPDQIPIGRYRLRVESIDPQIDWFIRITARAGYPKDEQAVTDYLHMAGISVARHLATGLPFEWEETQLRLDLRPHLTARHCDGSGSDILSLAHLLRDCHNALRHFPAAPQIKAQADKRYSRIESARSSLKQGCESNDFAFLGDEAGAWAAEHSDWIEGWVSESNFDFHRRETAQPLHGEIHPGNILFDLSDGHPVLIDFEESPFTYAPPEWDIAYFVQRFVVDGSEDQRSRIEQILDICETDERRVFTMMAESARCVVCIAAMLAIEDGIETPVSEYEKFRRLEIQALEFLEHG